MYHGIYIVASISCWFCVLFSTRHCTVPSTAGSKDAPGSLHRSFHAPPLRPLPVLHHAQNTLINHPQSNARNKHAPIQPTAPYVQTVPPHLTLQYHQAHTPNVSSRSAPGYGSIGAIARVASAALFFWRCRWWSASLRCFCMGLAGGGCTWGVLCEGVEGAEQPTV